MIEITRNGKTVAKLVNPNVSAVDTISGILKGRVSEDVDRHSIRDERLSNHALMIDTQKSLKTKTGQRDRS